MAISGGVVFMVGLWGGAYALSLVPKWAGFPTFLTAILIAALGFALFACGVDAENKKEQG